MKAFFIRTVPAVFSFIVITMALTTCTNPFSSDEKETGEFTISINANSSRMAYTTTPDITKLRFEFHFEPHGSGTKNDFTVEGKSTLKDKVAVGHYTVTMDVYDLEDSSLYARGVADNNPVEIKATLTTINIDAYNAENAEPPVITAQPQGAAYPVGAATVTALSVTASTKETGALTYQWYSNTTGTISAGDTAVSGATAASYTPPSTITATAGTTYYYVKITNTSIGSPTTITSHQAAIVVNANAATPTIATQPVATNNIHIGETVTVSVAASATDGGSLTYQWYSNTANNTNGTAISGATAASYTRQATWAALTETVYYYVVVTNTNNSAPGHKTATATSSVATVTVSPGAGTSGDPFIVHDPASLKRVGKGSNAAWTGNWALTAGVYYKQVRDIDMTGVNDFSPIGTSSNRFWGNYDADGHTISNLTINNPSTDYQGLFGYIGASNVIMNIGLVNCSITGKQYVGGVAGYNDGTVQNCYVTGNVTGTTYVGGVVGFSDSLLQNCYATSNVTGTERVGGVVGGSNGTTKNCYATGTVSGTGEYFGGVVGLRNADTVQYCVALNPNVSGSSNVGRVVGYAATNNYGRKDMKKNGSYTPGITWTSNANGVDGADIEAAQWGDESWWQTQGFTTANWDFTGISETHLPKLVGPGGTQNPEIKNN